MDLQQQLRLAAAMLQMQHAAASITVPPAVPPTFALTPPNENSPPQDARVRCCFIIIFYSLFTTREIVRQGGTGGIEARVSCWGRDALL